MDKGKRGRYVERRRDWGLDVLIFEEVGGWGG
jgi:hypothetical protein